MDTRWVGTPEGIDIWSLYKNENRLCPLTITHNLNIPIISQGFRIKFRDFATTNHILGHGNFYLFDETGIKFQILSLTENEVVFELYPRVIGLMEYQLEILEEPEHYLISLTTGGSVDSQGEDVEYTINWDDGSELIWTLEPQQLHAYTSAGSYLIRAKARSTGIETPWSLPKIVSVYNKDILVYTPIVESGPTSLALGDIGTFIVGQDNLGTTGDDDIEVRFDWGDYTYSNWSSDLNASHAWTRVGSYGVKCQARIKNSTVFSLWSAIYNVDVPEVIISVQVVEEGIYDLLKTPSPVILNQKVLVNSSVLVDTQKLNLTPTQVIEFKFDFGDGTSSDWSEAPSTLHIWRNSGNTKILCKMRARDIRFPEIDWYEFEWSDVTPISVVSRILSDPSVPEGPSEILCRPPNKITLDPPGEITEFSFEKKWGSEWIRVPGSGITQLSHPGGCIPYLIYVEFDLEGSSDERAYEDEFRVVTDNTDLEITVLNHYPITENSFYVNFHQYLESTNNYTGSRVTFIASRYKIYMRY